MNKISKKLTAIYIAAFSFLATAQTAYASEFASSKLATGTKRLIDDVTLWLLIIAPIAGALCIIYFAIRRSAADEMDEKKWKSRIVIALVSTGVALLATSLVKLISSYYS